MKSDFTETVKALREAATKQDVYFRSAGALHWSGSALRTLADALEQAGQVNARGKAFASPGYETWLHGECERVVEQLKAAGLCGGGG